MRNYIGLKNGQGMVVQRARFFYNIDYGTKIKQKNLGIFHYKNPLAEAVLEIIEKNNLEYIIAGSDNDSIVLLNKGSEVRMCGGKRIYISWVYWIKELSANMIFSMDSASIKYPYYTMFSWKDMYDILIIAGEKGFRNESEVIKNKSFVGGSLSLSQKEKLIVKHVLLYTKRIYNLNMKDDPTREDIDELNKYSEVNHMYCEQIYEEIKKEYNKTLKKIKQKTIGKNNRREVVNDYYK